MTSDDYIERLNESARDGDTAMRATLANHPLLASDVLGALCADPSSMVRAAAATNPALDGLMAATLSEDPNALVRRALLTQPFLDEEIVMRLVADSDPEVQRRAAAHACLPSSLRELVTSLDGKLAQLREGLARKMRWMQALENGPLSNDDPAARLAFERMRRRHEESTTTSPPADVRPEPEWDDVVGPADDAGGWSSDEGPCEPEA